MAKEFASPVSGKRITSEIAGALWEWPPAVCGRHTDETSLERSKVWCMDSYAKFVELALNSEETGVSLKRSFFFFKDKVDEIPAQLEKMHDLCHLPGFRHDENLISSSGMLTKADASLSPASLLFSFSRKFDREMRKTLDLISSFFT